MTMNRRVIVVAALLTAAFCPWNPTLAQSVSNLSVAIIPSRPRPLEFRDERSIHIEVEPATSEKPRLSSHVLYGGGAGLVLGGAYYFITCEASCRAEGSQGEHLLMLPVAVGIGAATGLVIGLVRHAQ